MYIYSIINQVIIEIHNAYVFTNFKGKDGRFRQNLRQDIIGLMELYEAVQLCLKEKTLLMRLYITVARFFKNA